MASYLDGNGLARVWAKIKNVFADKEYVSQELAKKADDASVAHIVNNFEYGGVIYLNSATMENGKIVLANATYDSDNEKIIVK